MIGRRRLWRLGRLLYRHARRDGPNDPNRNGEYELQTRLAKIVARRGEPFTAIDIGANLGHWSWHLSDACRSAGVGEVRLWAFEPSEKLREGLAERILSSQPSRYQVTVRPEAVSDHIGSGAFDASEGISGIKSLVISPADRRPVAEVTVCTLAGFFAEAHLSKVDFVKSDAEGFDRRILQGALPLLEAGRIGLFQFEYNHRWVETRSFLLDVFDMVERLPYLITKITPERLEPYERWHPELETFFEANFLLVRDDWRAPLGLTVRRA